MNEKVTKGQIDKMVEFMVSHEDLARGSLLNSSEGRTVSNRLWDDLRKQLNSMGPPTKTCNEWRRFWTLRKHRTRQKLSKNKSSLKKTGAGPFEQLQLGQIDDKIAAACGLEAAVEGIPNVNTFGAPNRNPECFDEEMEYLDSEMDEDLIPQAITSNKSSAPKKKSPKKSYKQKALEQQAEFLTTIKEIKNCVVDYIATSRREREAERSIRKAELSLKHLEVQVLQKINLIKMAKLSFEDN